MKAFASLAAAALLAACGSSPKPEPAAETPAPSVETEAAKIERLTSPRIRSASSPASLFDGHDAAINIMRRIIQATGAEVIHLGHDRSVEDVVNTAIQEDAHAIAMTSYQGGHTEYFKYMYDLLKERGRGAYQDLRRRWRDHPARARSRSCTTTASRACTTRMTAARWACRA
jgi:hypothetical protein